MMKKLLFMAALLVPGLAHGQNPSADLSVQVVSPNGIACDYGPNTTLPTGTAGTDMSAAGFTHCVLNADFTDNSGTAGGNGWVMNNPNTWLNNCAGTSVWGRFWLQWLNSITTNGDPGGQTPCARAQLISDGGIQALNFQFGPSDIAPPNRVGIALYWPLCGNNCAGMSPALPIPMYEEITYKLAAGMSQSASNIIQFWDENTVFDGDPLGGPSGFLDQSWLETTGNGVSSYTALDNYRNGSLGKQTVYYQMVPPATAYHTYAHLNTWDGSTNLVSCSYLDGAGVSGFTSTGGWDGTYCAHWAAIQADEVPPHDRRFFQGLFNNSTANNNLSLNIQKIRIFTCSNYKGSGNNCTGTLVFH
jgi:hypothetical protein